MKYLKFNLFFILLTSILTTPYAQESLKEKYDNILEETETFKQYKVIPQATLDDLWSQVMDSVSQRNREINELKSEVADQNGKIEALTSDKEAIQAELDKSLSVNDSIYFLGIQFSKLGYHIMVWAIIVILLVLGAIAYSMYFRSNRATAKYKKEYEVLNAEYETHKTKSREKQVKLKRELQTAVNTLEEKKKAWS